MIVKMNKYAFMVYHREYDQFLRTLQSLGVVHVRETRSIGDNQELQTLLTQRKRINGLQRQLKRLVELSGKNGCFQPARTIEEKEGFALLDRIEALQEKKVHLQAVMQLVEKEIAYMDVWGDFSFDHLNQLKEAGFVVGFYTCPTSRFEPKWVDQYNAVLIENFQSVTYFVTITRQGEIVDIDADAAKMPELSWNDLQTKQVETLNAIDTVEAEILDFALEQCNTIDAFDCQLTNTFNLLNIHVQTDRQAEDKLMCLEGWVPENKKSELENVLESDGYFFELLEIEENDNVPIQLKNNHFSKLFEPITKMFSLPNYAEFDPTPLLAPFFMLFFGLCFGDGGYGLLVVILCTVMKKKVAEGFRPFLSLFQYLGAAAIFVGTITGSFFGIELAKIDAFAPVKDYFLNSDNLMTLSIVIGIIQILFGKAVAAYKIKVQKGTKHSLAPFAWVFILASMALAFGLPMLNVHLPQPVIYVLYGIAGAGALLAFFYNTPGKNPLLNFGKGVYKTYETASGMLGDTLSYIRLFAIGLTGAILGGVFNTLAVSMTDGMNIVARVITMLLILAVGHAINFGLCTISSLVHPLRLIFVEYYKNAEFEGGGKPYTPYKVINN